MRGGVTRHQTPIWVSVRVAPDKGRRLLASGLQPFPRGEIGRPVAKGWRSDGGLDASPPRPVHARHMRKSPARWVRVKEVKCSC